MTTDAWAPRDVTDVPWPEPQRYKYLFGIDVLSEPVTPIAMTGTEAIELAGLQATIRLGQFPRIDDSAAASLARLFGPSETPIEAALADLMRAAGIEVPPSVDERDYAQRLIAIRRG